MYLDLRNNKTFFVLLKNKSECKMSPFPGIKVRRPKEGYVSDYNTEK